jgi:hypothetical protein
MVGHWFCSQSVGRRVIVPVCQWYIWRELGKSGSGTRQFAGRQVSTGWVPTIWGAIGEEERRPCSAVPPVLKRPSLSGM